MACTIGRECIHQYDTSKPRPRLSPAECVPPHAQCHHIVLYNGELRLRRPMPPTESIRIKYSKSPALSFAFVCRQIQGNPTIRPLGVHRSAIAIAERFYPSIVYNVQSRMQLKGVCDIIREEGGYEVVRGSSPVQRLRTFNFKTIFRILNGTMASRQIICNRYMPDSSTTHMLT